MMFQGSLRYHALWAYSVLAPVLIYLQVSVNDMIMILAPIAVIIAYDVNKHKQDNKSVENTDYSNIPTQ